MGPRQLDHVQWDGLGAAVTAQASEPAGDVVPSAGDAVERAGARWVPAFPGQRAPFTPGNVLSLSYGAFSDRAVTPVAQRVADLVVDLAPALAPFPLQVDVFARTYATVLLLEAQLDRQGVTDAEGRPPEGLHKWRSHYLRQSSQQLREMGLTRKAAAELQFDVAAAAQAAMSAARGVSEASPEMQAFMRERGWLPGDADAAPAEPAEGGEGGEPGDG